MGKSSKGTKGYKYFTSLVLMLGNRIECLLGVNFDKKGWIKPNNLKTDIFAGSHLFDYPELYGDTEGGISGQLALYDGNTAQMPDSHYQQYYPLAPAYRHQSYVVLQDFYVGNSPYLKDVMFFPKRTRVRNDGSEQWYKVREDGAVVCEIGAYNATIMPEKNGYGIVVAESDALVYTVDYQKSEPGLWTITQKTIAGTVGTTLNTKLSLSDISTYEVESIFDADTYYKLSLQNNGAIYNEFGSFVDWHWGNGRREKDNLISAGGNATMTFGNLDFDCYLFCRIGGRESIEINRVAILGDGGIVKHVIKNSGMQYSVAQHHYVVLLKKGSMFTVDWNCPASVNNLVSNMVSDAFYVAARLDSYTEIEGIDINPIHKAREIITDYTAMNKPESDVNDANFRAAADRIWDEGLGISWAIQEKSCKDALDELAAHIEGGFRINRQTGLYEVVLFRDDLLDLENALHFDESNIKHMEFESYYAEDAVNSYNVSYYDRENLKDSTFSIDDTGLIHTVGFVNAEKLDFPYFMNRRNAEIVANWKLKQVSTAAWKGSFTTGRYEARKLNKFDVTLLSWQSKQLTQLPVRVLNISLGDGKDNTVTVDFIEVVSYSENMNATINGDESISKVLEPQPNNAVVFEAPYYSLVQQNGQAAVNLELENNADAGYLMIAVSKPQNNSMYASVYTDKATEDYAQMQKVGAVDYCPSLMLDQDISFTESAFIVKNANAMSQAKVGTLILLDDELLVYQNYDTQTKLLTVKRAALDTVPQPHLKDAVFYFFDDFHFLDSEQYVVSETVQVQVLTTTPSAVQKREPSIVRKLELNSRAIRPYPPANVKINNEYYPTEIESDLVLTWVNRNRPQQTGGEILGYFDGGVTLENSVNYQLILTEFNEERIELRTQNINVGQLNSYTFVASAMQANTFAIEITLKSLRDGCECFQPFAHTVELSRFYSAPYDLTVEFKND